MYTRTSAQQTVNTRGLNSMQKKLLYLPNQSSNKNIVTKKKHYHVRIMSSSMDTIEHQH